LLGMIAPSPLTVICLEVQNDICDFARRCLERKFGFAVIRCSATLGEISALAYRVAPATLLSDAVFLSELPRSAIRELWTSKRVRVLLVLDSKENDERALAYIREGCTGVLHLDDSPELCQKAIRSVVEGEVWVSRKIASLVLRELLQLDFEPLRKLTPRESEILEMIGLGYDNRDIAGRLFISKETVRWHVRSLYSKIGVSDRASAIQFWRLTRGKAST
jgi:DNA-binding NarL/FixJ family response regulator